MSREAGGSCHPGAAVSDALLDPVARGRVADRLDPAALLAGNDQLQAPPPLIHVQQGPRPRREPSRLRRIGTWLESIARSPSRQVTISRAPELSW